MIDELKHQIEALPAEKAGVVLATAGTGGMTIQTFTEWANLIVTGGNAVLVMGGIYLLWHKIKKSPRTRRKDDSGQTSSL